MNKNEKICIIIDKIDEANFISNTVSESGYLVDCFQDTTKGLNAIESNAYRLIIVSYNLQMMQVWCLFKEFMRDGLL